MKSKIFWSIITGTIFLLLASSMIDSFPDFSTYKYQFQKALPGVLGFVFFYLCAQLLRAYRYILLVGGNNNETNLRILVAFPWLFAVAGMLPMRLGEPLRAVWLKKLNIDLSKSITAALFERLGDVIVLVVISLISMPFLKENLDHKVSYIVWAGSILMLFFYFLVGPILKTFRSLIGKIKKTNRAVSWVEDFADEMISVALPRTALKNILLSIIIWVFVGLALGSLLKKLDPETTFIISIVFAASVNLASILPLLPGNFGTFHVAGTGFLVLMGQPESFALSSTVVVHTIMISFVTTTALLSWFADLMVYEVRSRK